MVEDARTGRFDEGTAGPEESSSSEDEDVQDGSGRTRQPDDTEGIFELDVGKEERFDSRRVPVYEDEYLVGVLKNLGLEAEYESSANQVN